MFYAVKNHTSQSVFPCSEPWKFSASSPISDDIRLNKVSRQDWYQNAGTDHNFYSGVEGVNPNMRVSKSNPPQFFHAFIADYEAEIQTENLVAGIEEIHRKPTWFERSLGGGVHMIWELEQPIRVGGDWKLAVEILNKAQYWLHLDRFPALDTPAFLDPTRYYCNGSKWTPTRLGKIPAHNVQAFFFDTVKGLRRNNGGANIPIEVLEAALKERYPGFSWPEEFKFESQGPSFWIPESTSPKSAIVKKDGIFTFSGHAEKAFYSWGDLLGVNFVKEYQEKTIGDATRNIHFDGKSYWHYIGGVWRPCSKMETDIHFLVDHNLCAQTRKGEASQMVQAFNFIHRHQRIHNAGPFVLRPSGIIEDFLGKRVLNTVEYRVVQPATGPQAWGSGGEFPFLSMLYDNLFDPPGQLPWYLAWFKHAYVNALGKDPRPGQNIFKMGGTGIGKTLNSRNVIGAALGGFIDASDYLIHGATFNSHYMEHPVWCIDDDTANEDPRRQQKFVTCLKKCSANDVHTCNRKFEVSGNVQWLGRIVCTSNLDAVSSQIIGPMDQSIRDKTNLYRCAAKPGFEFPDRAIVAASIKRELPFFLKWLIDWDPPSYIERDSRFGYHSYQEEALLAMSLQNSPAALLKEVLMVTLTSFFQQNPEAQVWTGSMFTILSLITCTNPAGAEMVRKISHAAMLRYLALIEKEAAIRMTSQVMKGNVKVYTFYRDDYQETTFSASRTGTDS